MKSYRQRSIPQRLETARVALNNATTVSDVTGKLGEHGYPAAKIAQGKALYGAAALNVSDTTARLGAQKAATQHVNACYTTVGRAYQALAKTARALFHKDAGALGILGLTGHMPIERARLLMAATTLFNTTKYTPEMRAALAEHGYTDAKLSVERGKIGGLQFAAEVQSQTRAAYQQARETQAAALKAMDDWMARFLKIARVAFAGNPQALEQLGVIVRSRPTKAQIQGRRKAAATRLAKKTVKLAA
jgi:hypothetical protein